MLRGFLLTLCLTAFQGVFGQIQPLFEVPPSVYWRGNAVTFFKYRNDANCLLLATNSSVINGYVGFDEQNGWFGGLQQFTVKTDSSTCLKVPSKKLGNAATTWIRFVFLGNNKGCSVGYNSGFSYNINYYSSSDCREGTQQSTVNFWDANGKMIPREDECFMDMGAGGSQSAIYYRTFCDVVLPNTTTTTTTTNTNVYPTTLVTNNVTNTIIQVQNLTNTIVQRMPVSLNLDEVLSVVVDLMKRNASAFTILPRDFIPAAPASPVPVIASLIAPANRNQTSAGGSLTQSSYLIAMSVLIFFYEAVLIGFDVGFVLLVHAISHCCSILFLLLQNLTILVRQKNMPQQRRADTCAKYAV
jgi:hypothetical protein